MAKIAKKPVTPEEVFDACEKFLALLPKWVDADPRSPLAMPIEVFAHDSNITGALQWQGFTIIRAIEQWGLGTDVARDQLRPALAAIYIDHHRKHRHAEQRCKSEPERKQLAESHQLEVHARMQECLKERYNRPTNWNAISDFLFNPGCVYSGTIKYPDGKCVFIGGGGMLPRIDRARPLVFEIQDVQRAAAMLRAGFSPEKVRSDTKDRQDRRRDRDADSKVAWALMEKTPRPTLRELAEHLGCSTGYASELPAWLQKGNRRKGRPKTVSLTHKMEGSIGLPDASLEELIAEQRVDDRTHRIKSNGRH